jgi:hypothetical protein
MAALHPDERRDSTLLESPFHLVGGQRELERIGIPADHLMNGVDLFERGRHRALTRELDRHINRPELAADSAGPQARDVGHDRWLRLCDVELLEVPLRLFPERPGVVVVTIDERRLLEQPAGTFEQGGVVRLREHGGDGQADAESGPETGQHSLILNAEC